MGETRSRMAETARHGSRTLLPACIRAAEVTTALAMGYHRPAIAVHGLRG